MEKREEKNNNIIDQLQKKYNKTYMDILKHQKDLERWIKAGNRKKGDIRRSLLRLDAKYEQLCLIEKKLKSHWVREEDILKGLPSNIPNYRLSTIKNKNSSLYRYANIEQPIKYNDTIENRYGRNIDIIEDIPSSFKVRNNEKSVKFIDRVKNKFLKVKKIIGQTTAVGMAGLIAFFGGTTVGETNSNVKVEKNEKAYTETYKGNNEFKNSLFFNTNNVKVQSVSVKLDTKSVSSKKIKEQNKNKKDESTKEGHNKKENNKESKIDKEKNDNNLDYGSETYEVEKGTKYTSVSDGTGSVGYFSKDMKVKVYNTALVKTDKYGNKTILMATNKNESLNDYIKNNKQKAKEIERYRQSKDVAVCYSLQSVNGKQLFGWVNKDQLKEKQKYKVKISEVKIDEVKISEKEEDTQR